MEMEFDKANEGSLRMPNQEAVFQEISSRINDPEILEEISKKFDFSSQQYFMDSFRQNLLSKKSSVRSLISDDHVDKLGEEEIFTIAPETIVLEFGRPSLVIQNGAFKLPQSKIWQQRFNNRQNANNIYNNIESVGRIELRNHITHDWAGTGWLIEGSQFIVTNRHVATMFSNIDKPFVFLKNPNNKSIETSIDFKQEHRIDSSLEFKISEVVYISPKSEPDIAILKVESSTNLPPGLKISSGKAEMDSIVYTLGYPAKDSRVLDSSLMDSIFNGVYNVKRLAPGKITNVKQYDNEYHHDCSTLGGNSGSPVIDMLTGEVVGVHHAGSYKRFNWAVQSEYLNYIIKTKL